MRRLAPITLMIVVWMGPALSASAGGDVWEVETYHRAGDQVLATAVVTKDDNGQLGSHEQGPFLVYLAQSGAEYIWPGLPEGALLVGLVEVNEGSHLAASKWPMGPNQAIARFEIPDMESGLYQILHCNDPCTTTLGDIVGGPDLRIVGGPGGRPAGTVAAEVRESARHLPLLHRREPATTVGGVPATPREVGSESEPARIVAMHRGPGSSSGEVRPITADSEGESLADVLTIGVVASVLAMVWVGWNRGPEKKDKEVVG